MLGTYAGMNDQDYWRWAQTTKEIHWSCLTISCSKWNSGKRRKKCRVCDLEIERKDCEKAHKGRWGAGESLMVAFMHCCEILSAYHLISSLMGTGWLVIWAIFWCNCKQPVNALRFDCVRGWHFCPRVTVPQVLHRSTIFRKRSRSFFKEYSLVVWITRDMSVKQDSGLSQNYLPLQRAITSVTFFPHRKGWPNTPKLFYFYQMKWEKRMWLFLIQWRSHLHFKTIIIE